MLKVVICGAAGRMGRQLIADVVTSDDLKLAGAVEIADCPAIGEDAAQLAGQRPCGVKITGDFGAAVTGADAVVIFATGGVVKMATQAVKAKCSVVIGTTALPPADREALAELAAAGGRIVFAPNMSVGVNLLFHLVREAAKVLPASYDVEIVEMHHNLKKDAPSGTAVRLGEVVCEAREISYQENVRHGREGMVGVRPQGEIGMHSLRGGDVVGDHTVIFATGGERLELSHRASSRDTFARGALRAVRFLATAEPGLYDMQDVLGLR